MYQRKQPRAQKDYNTRTREKEMMQTTHTLAGERGANKIWQKFAAARIMAQLINYAFAPSHLKWFCSR
jgi:hypothetical protein